VRRHGLIRVLDRPEQVRDPELARRIGHLDGSVDDFEQGRRRALGLGWAHWSALPISPHAKPGRSPRPRDIIAG
jgi:hypothetical protein